MCGPAALDWITALRAPQIKALVRDGRAAAVAVRRRGPGRDHLPGLSRRAAGVPATTRSWKPSGPANARSCWPPPKPTWPRSPRLPSGNAGRCAARTRSRCARTGCSATTRWPSTSPSASPTITSASPATRTPSPPRPPSTASTCCAPASNPAASTAARWSPPTRRSPTSSGSSAPSTPTWTSAPSATAPRPGPRARVLADAVLLHHLAHARPPRAAPVHRRRQTTAQATRTNPVAAAARSPRALAKAAAKRTPADLPVHSFTSLLADLATICLNQIQPADPPCPPSGSSPPPPRCSARPSTCSASATASAPRSQKPVQHHPETPGKRPCTRITGGNFGLKAAG